MFDIILRNSSLNLGTQLQQATALDPTLIVVWLGNNDVLGFATSGGTSPSQPTSDQLFSQLYTILGDALGSLNADVILGNVFDVTTITFFNTVGPQMSQEIPWSVLASQGAPGLFYQMHGETIASGIADSLTLLTGGVLVTLSASSYAGLVGVPTGKFYIDNNFPGIPSGIDLSLIHI